MNRRSFFEMLGTASVALGLSARTAAKPAGAEQKLQEMGLSLPEATAALAVYSPYRITGNLVYIAGQVPPADLDIPTIGKLGRDLTTAEGHAAARHAGLRILAQLKAACGGDLGRVVQCVQLRGYVNCSDDFTEQSTVINGVSELLKDVFGNTGLGARAAVGCNALPRNMACEVESIFEIEV